MNETTRSLWFRAFSSSAVRSREPSVNSPELSGVNHRSRFKTRHAKKQQHGSYLSVRNQQLRPRQLIGSQ